MKNNRSTSGFQQKGDAPAKPPNLRQYHGRESHWFRVWNGILEHRERMGTAIYVFLWMIDKTTIERNGEGSVLGGAPVKIEQIARDLGTTYRTVQRDIDNLEDQNYIERLRTPYGFRFTVLNSCKFLGRDKKVDGETRQKCPVSQDGDRTNVSGETGQFCPERPDTCVRNKEDITNKRTQNTADAVAVGSVLGVEPDMAIGAVAVPDRRHPPSEETAKSDDDDENHRRRPPTSQELKAVAVSSFMKKHPGVDLKSAEQLAVLIEERALAKGTKIMTPEYFVTGLENEAAIKEVAKRMHGEQAPSSPDSANDNLDLGRGISVWADKLIESGAVSAEKAREKVWEFVNEDGTFGSWKKCHDFFALIRLNVFPDTPEPRENGEKSYFPETVSEMLDLASYPAPFNPIALNMIFKTILNYLHGLGEFKSTERRLAWERLIASQHQRKKSDEQRAGYRRKENRRRRKLRAQRKAAKRFE